MTGGPTPRLETACPGWCAQRHDADPATVHVGRRLQVGSTMLSLAASGDEDVVLHVDVGDQEYTLHEAEVLIAALTQLVDEARAATGPGVPRMRKPGP